MPSQKLEDMDFFDLKLLADKEGVLYTRSGEIFIYHGVNKIEISNEQPGTINPFGLGKLITDSLPGTDPNTLVIGDKVIKKLDVGKDIKCNGYFWFWQHDEYFVLCFVTETSNNHNGTVYLLRAGNALDSLEDTED